MKAVSDSGPTQPDQPKSQAVENLFQLMKAVSAPETLHFFEEEYQKCSIRYGDMKKQLAVDIANFCTPIRERIEELQNNDAYIEKVMKQGAEQARESARKTVAEIRKIIGFSNYR